MKANNPMPLTLTQANDLVDRADRLFHRAAKALERGNQRQCEAVRERAESLLVPFGIVAKYHPQYPAYPTFELDGRQFHTVESAVSAALEGKK